MILPYEVLRLPLLLESDDELVEAVGAVAAPAAPAVTVPVLHRRESSGAKLRHSPSPAGRDLTIVHNRPIMSIMKPPKVRYLIPTVLRVYLCTLHCIPEDLLRDLAVLLFPTYEANSHESWSSRRRKR